MWRLIAALCGLPILLFADAAIGQDVTVKVDGIENNVPVEGSSGWPLTIELYTNNATAVAYDYLPGPGPLVFFDAFREPFPTLLPPQEPFLCCPGTVPPDQLAAVFFGDSFFDSVQFRPELLPATSVNSPPQVLAGTRTASSLVSLPPLLGGNYGLSPNLPGLVVLTDAGTGLVFDQNFNLATPITERNVAGFVNSVLYTLNNEAAAPGQTGQLVIAAQLAVPPELFVPVVEVDDNVGLSPNGGLCTGQGGFGICSTATWMWRIDGEPVMTGSAGDLAAALDQRVVNIRIFVVNGNAPNQLADLNGDGVVNSQDAQLAGYQIISNELKIQVRNFRQNKGKIPPPGVPYSCTNTVVFEGSVRTDLDGNGLVTNSFFNTVPADGCR
jgi:hypothetical protein